MDTFFTDEAQQHATIPSNETEIKDRCFEYCRTLTSVQFESPSNVKTIEPYAFNGCKNLTCIDFLHLSSATSSSDDSSDDSSSSVQISSIQHGAFYLCSSLSYMTLPPSLELIGYGAFYHCTSLSSIAIPSSHLSTIGRGTFYNCTSLVSIMLPSSFVTIEGGSFHNCSSLVTIALPPSIVRVGNKAFLGCNQLHRVISGDTMAANMGDITRMRSRMSTNAANYNHTRLIKWLKHRFDDLPLHQICYDPNISTLKLQEFILQQQMATTVIATVTATDQMGMTALHILACNPSATIDHMETLLNIIKFNYNNHNNTATSMMMELLSMRNIHGFTPIDLFLACKGISALNFDNIINNDNVNNNDNHNNNHNDDVQEGGGREEQEEYFTLDNALEQGINWSDGLGCMIALSPNGRMGIEEKTVDLESGLYPFLKAATIQKCKLDVVYNLTIKNIDLLIELQS